MPDSIIIRGDARHIPLADESVQCVITSPPYWGLRDYKLEPRVYSDQVGRSSILRKGPIDSFPNGGRNIRTVWTIATQPFPEAHFATFPEKLVEPCVLAGTSERGCCAECGAPWERIVDRPSAPIEVFTSRSAPSDGFIHSGSADHGPMLGHGQKLQNWRNENPSKTVGWRRGCTCIPNANKTISGDLSGATWDELGEMIRPIPCTVLDPFAGSGTVGVVCARLNRRFVGIELSEDYCRMAAKRIAPYAAQAHLPLG